MTNSEKAAEIAQVLGIDISSDSSKLECKGGKFTVRREYYWRPKASPQEFFDNTLAKLEIKYGKENVQACKYGDVWKSFKGGEGVKKNSHYFMEFKINGY